jgi:hypothetical protein
VDDVVFADARDKRELPDADSTKPDGVKDNK